jgi:hypothetical protein
MYKYKTLLVVLTALCSFLPVLLQGQVDTAWVRRYNGPGNSYDEARSIAVDGQGNVYVTGKSYGSGTGYDYATIKYNSLGVQQWVQRYDGPGNYYDMAYAIAVDGLGNVYVTGYSWGSGTAYDYATIKYNSAGVQQWVQRYDGPGNDYDCAYAIALDGAENVYVTGYSIGSGISSDYATIKYDSAGVQQWVQRYDGPGNDYGYDYAYAIAVDGQGNVYVTGTSPDSGTYKDYATIKYNSNGVQQWVARYNGPGNDWDEAYAIAVDGAGNVYVIGYSIGSGTTEDYATIKYNSNGVQQWVQRYNGPGNSYDVARSLAVDGQENVYVTGYSIGSGTSEDYATIKYVQTPGIEEIASLPLTMTKGFEVYPNPAKSFFVVRIPQTLKQVQGDKCVVKMFDVTGKVVREIDSPSAHNDKVAELRISLDGIKNGVYFIQAGDEIINKKLVITK